MTNFGSTAFITCVAPWRLATSATTCSSEASIRSALNLAATAGPCFAATQATVRSARSRE